MCPLCAERGFAAAKDLVRDDLSCGWCRLKGRVSLMLPVTGLVLVRNRWILTAGPHAKTKTLAGSPSTGSS